MNHEEHEEHEAKNRGLAPSADSISRDALASGSMWALLNLLRTNQNYSSNF